MTTKYIQLKTRSASYTEARFAVQDFNSGMKFVITSTKEIITRAELKARGYYAAIIKYNNNGDITLGRV